MRLLQADRHVEDPGAADFDHVVLARQVGREFAVGRLARHDLLDGRIQGAVAARHHEGDFFDRAVGAHGNRDDRLRVRLFREFAHGVERLVHFDFLAHGARVLDHVRIRIAAAEQPAAAQAAGSGRELGGGVALCGFFVELAADGAQAFVALRFTLGFFALGQVQFFLGLSCRVLAGLLLPAGFLACSLLARQFLLRSLLAGGFALGGFLAGGFLPVCFALRQACLFLACGLARDGFLAGCFALGGFAARSFLLLRFTLCQACLFLLCLFQACRFLARSFLTYSFLTYSFLTYSFLTYSFLTYSFLGDGFLSCGFAPGGFLPLCLKLRLSCTFLAFGFAACGLHALGILAGLLGKACLFLRLFLFLCCAPLRFLVRQFPALGFLPFRLLARGVGLRCLLGARLLLQDGFALTGFVLDECDAFRLPLGGLVRGGLLGLDGVLAALFFVCGLGVGDVRQDHGGAFGRGRRRCGRRSRGRGRWCGSGRRFLRGWCRQRHCCGFVRIAAFGGENWCRRVIWRRRGRGCFLRCWGCSGLRLGRCQRNAQVVRSEAALFPREVQAGEAEGFTTQCEAQ